jgi:hypothetical protein
MKWLTLTEIKQQCRIEPDMTMEDDLLKKYGESAEQTVLNVCGRTYNELLELYGEIPTPLVQASLLLCDLSYQHRTPDALTQLYDTRAFDTLVAEYVRHTYGEIEQLQEFTLGSDIKILIEAELPDDLKMLDVDFTVVVYNNDLKDKKKTYAKSECIPTVDGSYVVLVNSEELGIGRYLVRATFQIPDTDYQSGTRKEVVKIDPHVLVKG